MPREVSKHFDCSFNKLTSLEGTPEKVEKWFCCKYNTTKFTKDDVNKVCKEVMHISV